MFTTAVTIGAALIGVALGQTGTPCESYDVASGTGVCNGTNVNIANVLCANGFDANVCKATLASTSGGNSETYFFKGTPAGLPIGTSIQSDCNAGDFPTSGLAMAQTYQDPSGQPAGCYPAADVQGTTMSYVLNGDVIGSVTVDFAAHTDGGGTQRDGFIQITCQSGGPTSNFVYSTVGDAGHPSQYEIDVTADCNLGGAVPSSGGKPAAASPTGWILIGLLCGVSAAYFGGGYVYNWKVKGAESGERIPQRDFWLSIPGLIKDGAGFIKAKVKKEEYTPL